MARCFKDSSRFIQCLKLNYGWLCMLFQWTALGSISGSTVAWAFLYVPVHILIESKECILKTDTICNKSSHIHRLVSFYKVNVEIETSLYLIFNHFVRLSDLNVLNTENGKVVASSRPPKVHRWILVLQVKLKSKISLDHWKYTYFWEEENDGGSLIGGLVYTPC